MKFELAMRLEGHEDWIRCVCCTQSDDGALMVASASQDKHIRLWRFMLMHQPRPPLNKPTGQPTTAPGPNKNSVKDGL